MTDPTEHSDLFQPVLGERDDAVGFDSPWRPNSLVFLTFFAGPVGGGALLGWNFKRLGMPRWALPTWIVFGVLAVGYPLLYGLFALPQGEDLNERTWRLGLRIVLVLTALLFAGLQRQRSELYQNSVGEPASLWGPGMVALILGSGIHFLLSVGVLMLFDIPAAESGG